MSKNDGPMSIYSIILFIIVSMLISTVVGKAKPYFPASTNHNTANLLTSLSSTNNFSSKLYTDRQSLSLASTDYGNIVRQYPAAVFRPSSGEDIASLIKYSYESTAPFTVAARGRSHSVRGQALAPGGVVIQMSGSHSQRILSVCRDSKGRDYVDVGSEVMWIDVLRETTSKYGLAPVAWTDYLYLTVGGTLSNAGISGQTFRHGPQISNVYEVDVITGRGEFLTCSPSENSDLFYAVLGGLGQFGIITRARIALETAPKRVKWVRMLYTDFAAFTRDQEHLISITDQPNALNYLEGSVLLTSNGPPEDWTSSSYPSASFEDVVSLITDNRIIYCIELAKYYDDDDHSQDTVNKDVEMLIQGLGHVPGFKFKTDVSYMEFLNRLRTTELQLESVGLWDVPHPWLNLFIPKSRIFDFNNLVFRNIILRRNITSGPLLVYPMNRNKWDDMMSAVIPEEDVFYTVGFLHSSGFDDWKRFDEQNKAVIKLCEDEGIKIKQYLPNHRTKQDWVNHFGSKWEIFQKTKARFDPKMILSPGQKIFN